MTTAQIESRLAALEREVATIKARQPNKTRDAHPVNVLEKIHGTFENDDAFREAVRLGKKWRKSLDAKTPRKAKLKR
jgi:hypothetical protein